MRTSICVITLLSIAALMAGDRPIGMWPSTRSDVIAAHGIAATSHPLATGIAIDILKKGGSAVDAAIAADAALGLMEPTSCGIGGDLFAIVWINSEKKLYGLNASGRSPYLLTLEEFRKRGLKEIPLVGPLPVSVPGCVDGWSELHKRFGKLPMSEVLAPTIDYANNGFPVTAVIAYYWGRGGKLLGGEKNFADTYLPGGRAPAEGEIFKNPDLAATLKKIAEGGRDAFYKGDIARAIDSYCQREGCLLRYRDLAEHSSTWVEPISTNYRGYDVWELPPNGQGLSVLEMLNTLEGFDLKSLGHNSAPYLHLLIEAKKLAFEDLAKYCADPDFAKIPVTELISKEYAARRRTLINPNKASQTVPAGQPGGGASDTIYLTVADADHNIVSLIQSNYSGFGSGLVPDGLGFCLQDRGALFNLAEGQANTYAPHKRPFHTIIPGFVTREGKPYLSFGVMGGDMQPQGHVQVLCNLIDFGMGLQEAGDAARFYHTGSSSETGEKMEKGGLVAFESGVPGEVQRELIRKGHRLQVVLGLFGGYQAILYDAKNDVYRAASESRKDGMAAGY